MMESNIVVNKIKSIESEVLVPVLHPGKRGYTKKRFVSDSIFHLSYEEGTSIQLIKECANVDQLMVKTAEGQTGIIQRDAVEFCHDAHLLLLDYYHGFTRPQTVECLMKEAEPGSYLLRDSIRTASGLSLEIKCCCPHRIHRMLILNENSLFYASNQVFKDIGDIIKSTTIHPNQPQYQISFMYPLNTKNSNRDYIVAKSLIKNRQLLKTRNVLLIDRIGGGEYGDIYRGTYNDQNVAIKEAKTANDFEDDIYQDVETIASPSPKGNFAIEAAMLHELYHKNIVNFIGGVLDKDKIVQIVMEWCDKGDLQTYISHNNDFEPHELLDILYQVAQGFKYLHSKKIVHGDIAARNILLTEDLTPKIGDFGFASYEKKVIPEKTLVPKRWIAPEVMVNKTMNLVSDVWSFGVLMWEVYSDGQLPYKDTEPDELYHMLTVENKRLPKPDKCSDCIYQIMLSCWDLNVNTRSTFKMIVDMLEEIKNVEDQGEKPIQNPS